MISDKPIVLGGPSLIFRVRGEGVGVRSLERDSQPGVNLGDPAGSQIRHLLFLEIHYL